MASKAPAKMRGVTVIFDEDGRISMVLIPDRRVVIARQSDGLWAACVHDEMGNPSWDHMPWQGACLESLIVEASKEPVRVKLKAEWTPV